jgi:signal transduction histidine kinase
MTYRILLVDDEEDIREILYLYLSEMGYEVMTADNAASALKCFKTFNPSIVLSDIKMPGMDGIALLQALKHENPDTEVIMITGHGDMNLAINSLKHEATDFVTKPINDDALEIALKRAIERITMRHQLRQYTENLEQLVEEKSRQLLESERMAAIGETVAGLSHAIKNIASMLQGSLFVLKQGIDQNDPENLENGWRMVEGNVNKIKNLSLDLLNYGKSADIKCCLNHPNTPIKEVADLLQPRAQSHGIEITMSFSQALRPFYFDPEGIHRVLLNLVTNAIDACLDEEAAGKPKTISLTSRQRDGWGVEYEVRDRGPGMDKDIRQKIFQSFFSTKGSQGTGIGLMMTQKIVNLHGGQIEVASEKGSGATFIVRLPDRQSPTA